jgi:ABC-type sugar transport system substrate-binding protein
MGRTLATGSGIARATRDEMPQATRERTGVEGDDRVHALVLVVAPKQEQRVAARVERVALARARRVGVVAGVKLEPHGTRIAAREARTPSTPVVGVARMPAPSVV